MSTKTAIIIGAGYGGMALANLLGKAGWQVRVVEKNAAPGGRIAFTRQDGFLFDLGPSWYLMPEVFDQYYQVFGQSASERLALQRLTPGYKVFFDDAEPLEIMGDVRRDRETFEAIEPGAGKRLERYVAKSAAVYDISVRRFLYNNFLRPSDLLQPEVLRRAPGMASLVRRPLDAYVSRQFRDLRLRQLLEYHMVFLGSSPFQAPAIYNLMSNLDYNSGVFYPKRGVVSLVEDMQALGEHYDISYEYDSPVERILVEDGAAVGVRLTGGREERADVVVSNADLHFTETALLESQYQGFPERYWRKRQPGPSALLVSLGVRGELPGLRHHNLYFTAKWRENFDAIYTSRTVPASSSMYVCNPTKTDPSLAPAGHETLFVLLPIAAGMSLDEAEQARLVEQTIAACAQAMDIPELPGRVVSRHVFGPDDFATTFNAWQSNAFGGESHLLRQSIFFRTPNKSRKVRGLYYVGAGTVPGIGLPMCLISAELVYKRLAGIKRSGPLLAGDMP